MNLEKLHQKVIAVARANPPSDRVPYAFEKRVLARLTAPLPLDEWAVWGRALWRAAAPCVAIMLVIGVWTYVSQLNHDDGGDLAQDLENAVVFTADHFGDNW
jgi:hypothetical protein